MHCDYRNCGANHADNNRLLAQFDKIAACSDGCRLAVESILPHLKEKCMTVRNCHRFEEIRKMAEENAVCYDTSKCNIVSVSRLSHEKGIERAIQAIDYVVQRGADAQLHIVGGGAMQGQLQEMVQTMQLAKNISFYGEQGNPYSYLKNADLLLLTSYHEAAPMVIEEASALGIPVFCTRTTSSDDMVLKPGIGFVCDNCQEAINETLLSVLASPDKLRALSEQMKMLSQTIDNAEALDSKR